MIGVTKLPSPPSLHASCRLPDVEVTYLSINQTRIPDFRSILSGNLTGMSINIRGKTSLLNGSSTIRISLQVDCDSWNLLLPSWFSQSLVPASLARVEVENNLAAVLRQPGGSSLQSIQFLHSDLCYNETSSLHPQICRSSKQRERSLLELSIDKAYKIQLSHNSQTIQCYRLTRAPQSLLPKGISSILQCNARLSDLPNHSDFSLSSSVVNNVSKTKDRTKFIITGGMIHILSWTADNESSVRHVKSISILADSLLIGGSLSRLDYFQPYTPTHPFVNSTCRSLGGLHSLLFTADNFVAIPTFPAFTRNWKLPAAQGELPSPGLDDYSSTNQGNKGRMLLQTSACTSDILQCNCKKIFEKTKVRLISAR
jgi:hypothetical protein